MLSWRQRPETQRSSCAPRWHCERWFWVWRSIHWTRIFSISNDSSWDHGYHFQIAGLRWTSSRRSIGLHPGENGRCSQIIENSQIDVRHLDSSTTTQNAKIMVQYGRPSRSSWKEFVRSSFGQDYCGKGSLRKSYWNMDGGEIPNWECLFVHREIGLFSSVYVDIKKETKHWSDVESTQQRSRFGRTNIFPGSCILGMHSKTMRSEPQYCGPLQNHVRIANFSGENREITILLKILRISSWSYDMAGSCKEVCGTILWVGKQDNSATLQSIYSMHRWPPLQRRRNEICWRIVTRVLSNCSEMLILGTYWTTWYSMVSEQTCTIGHKMDLSLRQTIKSFDLVHSSYMWQQTTLSCGTHCKTKQIGTVSRFWLRGRSGRFKINFEEHYVSSAVFCSIKLDVQETNGHFSQLNRIWNHLTGRRIESSPWKHDSEQW